MRKHTKFKTVKCSLEKIAKPELDREILFSAVDRLNKLPIHVYQFLRLWTLQNYYTERHTTQYPILPEISEDVLKMAFIALSTRDPRGGQAEGDNANILKEFGDFYTSDYQALGYPEKIDARLLTKSRDEIITQMKTAIENNIRRNFVKYIQRFVKESFKQQFKEQLTNLSAEDQKIRQNRQKADLYEVKKDIIENTYLSHSDYHDWIKTIKPFILPIKEEGVDFYDDLDKFSQKYLSGMIYICLELEKLKVKSFQFFPLRKNINLHYVPFDTASLISLFTNEDKGENNDHIMEVKHHIWSTFFNLNHQVFRSKYYQFDYHISTDGLYASIQMINKEMAPKNEKDKKASGIKGAETKQRRKKMTPEEKAEDIRRVKAEQRAITAQKAREKTKQKKEATKHLSKAEKDRLKQLEEEHPDEFPYFNELNPGQTEQLKQSNWIVCDPGRRDLFYFKNREGVTLKYSNRNYLADTYRLKYQRRLHKFRNTTMVTDDQSVAKLESGLAKFNSKTCDIGKFKDFIREKNRINSLLFEVYYNKIFRQYKWYAFLNKERAIACLANNIKDTYGDDCKIIMGDWSDTLRFKPHFKGFIPVPGIGLKRKLKEQIPIYNIDEYRTSCLHHQTEQRVDNLYLPDKIRKQRYMHSILTYTIPNGRKGCINRDNNATYNMIKIVESFFRDGSRPENFRRSDATTSKKEPTPLRSASKRSRRQTVTKLP